MSPSTRAKVLLLGAALFFAGLPVGGAAASQFDLEVYLIGDEGSATFGHDFLFDENDVTLTNLTFEDRLITFGFEADQRLLDRWRFAFHAPPGETIQVGHYPFALSTDSESLDHFLMDVGCDGPGMFTIHEATRSGTTLTSLSADFTSYCHDVRGDVFIGSIRYNASGTAAAPADTDGDGIDDTADNCVAIANPYQLNSDGDFAGDACDTIENDSIFIMEPGIGPPGEPRAGVEATPHWSRFRFNVNEVLGGLETTVHTGLNPYIHIRPYDGESLVVGSFSVKPTPGPGEVSMRIYDEYECIDPTGSITIDEYVPDANAPEDEQVENLSFDYAVSCQGSVPAVSGSVRWNATPKTASACAGRTITHSGTSGDDLIIGTPGDDVILGKGGNDTIRGGGGDDVICGGSGNDHVEGQGGADIIEGGDGDDTLLGGAGADTVAYRNSKNPVTLNLTLGVASGAGQDTLDSFLSVWGSDFNDTITGNAAANFIRGFSGNDVMNGKAGSDVLIGDAGDDLIQGATGADTLAGKSGNDVLKGMKGDDLLNGDADQDTLIGGEGSDELIGGAGHDVLEGNLGNDVLEGKTGDDSLYPGPGADSNDGGTGTDLVSFTGSSSAVTANLAAGTAAGDGVDTLARLEWLQGSKHDDDLTGAAGSNWIFGERGKDRILGGGGNDVLFGGGAADELFGEGGADTLVGGLSRDTLNGGPGLDTASYFDAPGGVTVNLTTNSAGGAMGNDTLAEIEDIVGGRYQDHLTGNSLSNWIEGRSSDDTIAGLDGNDFMFGFGGDDTIAGGSGDDYLDGMFGDDDVLDGGPGTDLCQESDDMVNCEIFPDADESTEHPHVQPRVALSADLPELWWYATGTGRF